MTELVETDAQYESGLFVGIGVGVGAALLVLVAAAVVVVLMRRRKAATPPAPNASGVAGAASAAPEMTSARTGAYDVLPLKVEYSGLDAFDQGSVDYKKLSDLH